MEKETNTPSASFLKTNTAQLKKNILLTLTFFRRGEQGFLILIAIVIGLLGGFGNFLFRETIDFFHKFVFETLYTVMRVSEGGWHTVLICLIPMVGGLLLIPLALVFGKEEVFGYGFPEFLKTIALKGGIFKLRNLFIKGLAASITLGIGGSAGQEGPIAAIGGTIGSWVGQLLKVSTRQMKVMVASGVAAGIAATFNAPIAGVFFAFEIVMLGNYELTNFAPVVIASAMGTVITHVLLGAEPAFTIPPYHVTSIWEIPLYLILGLLSAVFGIYFIRFFYYTKDLFDKISFPPYFKPALGGLLVGIIGIGFPQVFGNGYEFAQQALFGEMGWKLLLGLFIFKMIATSITLGSGGSGGVFAPLIYIGVMMGGIYGYAVHALFPAFTASPEVYALVGMGAFLAAVSHAPLTGLFLLFELSGDYHVIIPGMIACIIGTVAAHVLQPDSIDTLELTRQGINLHQGRDINVLRNIPVREVMIKEMDILPEDLPLRQILMRAKESVQSYFPVISRNGELLGVISLRDIRPLLMEEELMNLIIAKDIVDENYLYLTPEDNLDTAMKKFAQKDLGQLPVVDPQNPRKLIGMLKRTDVINAYNNAILKLSME